MLAWESFPTLSPLLRDRKLALAALGSAALLLSLSASGVAGWQCPFLHITGIPCPGCGLTRATYLLLRGDIHASLTFHAFAPIVLLGIAVVGSAGLLPDRARQPWIDKLVILERRTGVILILLAALIVYWLARLIFMNSAFIQLIRG
jgi:Protein of unknown function (DUF2752)